MSRRHAIIHYGTGLLAAAVTALGFILGWHFQVESARWMVLIGVVGSLVFCFRTYYLGSRGVDLTDLRD